MIRSYTSGYIQTTNKKGKGSTKQDKKSTKGANKHMLKRKNKTCEAW